MDESILGSIKALMSINEDDSVFDTEIIIFINSALFTLCQLGVGPYTPFKITGLNETWSDFLPDIDNLSMVKTYVYLKTRLMFDPPASAALMTAMKEQIAESEWRLNVETDRS